MKIGITSQNFRTITGHAGKTRRFLVYSRGLDNEITEIDRIDLPKEMSMHEFNGTEHPVDQLDVLITAGCGQGFINKLQKRGVRVVQTGETRPLEAVRCLLDGLPLVPPEPHSHNHGDNKVSHSTRI